PRDGLLYACLDLDADAVGIDGLAWLHDAPHVEQADLPRGCDLDLRDLSDVGVVINGARDPSTVARRQRPPAPATALGDALDDPPEARIIDMPQTERERLLARCGRELVHERFDREDVLRGRERSEVRRPQAC